MSALKKHGSKSFDDPKLTPAEEQAKVKQLREALGPLSGRAAIFCTYDCLHRYLRARNWNDKKAEKMLRECLKWRASYKPEEIKWAEVAKEAETGKVYRANLSDRWGRITPVGKNQASMEEEELVGCKIKVWWPLDKRFYKGSVISYDAKKNAALNCVSACEWIILTSRSSEPFIEVLDPKFGA